MLYNPKGEPIILDDFQEEIVDDTIARLKAADQQGERIVHGICSATGTGKTEIAMAIFDRILRETPDGINPTHGWLAERTLLRNESRDRINTAFKKEVAVSLIDEGVGRRRLLPNMINILSPQTFCVRGGGFKHGHRDMAYEHVAGMANIFPWGVLFADEAHHSTADYYGSVIRAWPGHVIGLSGTWWCMGDYDALGEGMHGSRGKCGPFQTLSYAPEPRDLINVRLSDIQMADIDYRLLVDHRMLKANVSTVDGYDFGSVDEAVGRILVQSSAVVRTWEENGSVPCLAFCRSKAAAYQSAQVFRDHGYRADTVVAETPEEDRKRILTDLNEGRLHWVASVDVFGEGVNVPNVRAIAMLRPTKSQVRNRQFWGRGLRIREDLSPLLAFDFANNIYYNGSPLEGWSQMGLRARKMDRKKGVFPVFCPSCDTNVVWSQPNCYQCGEELSWVCTEDTITMSNGEEIHVTGHNYRHWCENYDRRSRKVCIEAIQNAINEWQIKQEKELREQRIEAERQKQAAIEAARQAEIERRQRHTEEMREANLQNEADRLEREGPEWRWDWQKLDSPWLATKVLKSQDGQRSFIANVRRSDLKLIVLDNVTLETIDLGAVSAGIDTRETCQRASKIIHEWHSELTGSAHANVDVEPFLYYE